MEKNTPCGPVGRIQEKEHNRGENRSLPGLGVVPWERVGHEECTAFRSLCPGFPTSVQHVLRNAEVKKRVAVILH